MKLLVTSLFLPFAAMSVASCGGDRDAPTGDAPETEQTADRPATISDPNEGRSAGARQTPGTREGQNNAATTPGEGGAAMHAVAEIMPTSGNEARGAVRLSGGNGTVKISGTITGLEPGAHGIHIHEFGDCSAPDASSAGEHFNPHDDPHGSPRDLEDAHHVGDLGNITANEQGEAEINLEDNEMQLSGQESVIGKAMVVHSEQDDFETQPSGDSGARVGCGEIVESSDRG